MPKEKYWSVKRGFGNEFWVDDPSKARVIKVIPMAEAKRDNRLHSKIMENRIVGPEDLKEFFDQVKKLVKQSDERNRMEKAAFSVDAPFKTDIIQGELQKAKVYVQEKEDVPEGRGIKVGPRGGKYYLSEEVISGGPPSAKKEPLFTPSGVRIPPGWENVKLASSKSSPLQATGIDGGSG